MQFVSDVALPCPSCNGKRFRDEVLAFQFDGKSVGDLMAMSVTEVRVFLGGRTPASQQLAVLEEVGLGYLKLGQAANTLSGGEAQRLKLAAELARRDHSGRLYVLDEPTTGLHWDDIAKLLALLGRLRDAGATLIVIEHHADVILAADHVMELGPEGGEKGGKLVYAGLPEGLLKQKGSPTGRALAGS